MPSEIERKYRARPGGLPDITFRPATSIISVSSGEALPDAKVVRRELAGVPRVEVVGLSREKVEETFWDRVTQVRADLAGIQRK